MEDKGLIANKYKIQRKIGEGKFGVVFSGIHIKTEEKVAIKVEEQRTCVKLLKNEASIMKYLYDHGCRNIPIVFWYGIYKESVSLVMSLYECSLHDYIKIKELSPNKINSIMVYAISILESIHNNYVLHRDIKPQNFMLKEGELYLIDFGMSTFYIDEESSHLNDLGKINQHITGTPKYASINIHEGYTPSRRDDMISLGYMYLYLYYRELPWDNLASNFEEEPLLEESHILYSKNKKRLHMKGMNELRTSYNTINQNIIDYLNYCYQLKYQDSPNYSAIKNIFINNYFDSKLESSTALI